MTTNWNDITFDQPGYFYLLLLLLPAFIWYVMYRKKSHATLQVSTTGILAITGKSYKHYLRHLPPVLRALIFVLLVTVLARPQSLDSWENTSVEGIDIIITTDISGSMLAKDFDPDRLEASKEVAKEFIKNRPNDRIGLVVFSGESFTQCPLTTDHSVLINLFGDIKSGMIKDGTAIGMGLASAVNRLKESDAKSKVIILLTDGVNNSGSIAPLTAAEIAEKFNIRVYTIGVGSQGTAPFPVQSPYGGIQYVDQEVEIDEEILQQIAEMTKGEYFRATDNESLVEVYKKIDQLEKSKIDVTEFSKKKEEFLPFAILAVFLLLIEILFRNTILRTVP
ncbi:vWA domain-containing protein [Chondrinema litorale]|uniref:vWA domain-containing protein n=1 Tax=Chondrinema litorale TaxID=2994555 RepID=UPI002543BDDC|nr:VWA domain-containing protein [Chondrinema litorale]UZR92824.1 VWA domain-containing protein [Chondrinema litorale]